MGWDSKSYFSKAQIYWSKASSTERDSDQFKLYVSFVCEFMIRGALCFKHPSLNAAMDSESLLFAAGIESRKSETTVAVIEAMKRFIRIIPDFPSEASSKVEAMFVARNKELHSDKAELGELAVRDLMPSIYQLMVHATNFANQDIVALLGKEDADQAMQVVKAVSKDRKNRVENLIKVCKDRFYHLPKDEQENVRREKQITYISAVLSSGHHVKREKCPSCASNGLIIGTPVGRSSPILRDNAVFVEVRVIPSKFECKCCNLEINGLDEIMAAGFSYEYCTFDDVDVVEHFKIDPIEYIDVEEVVREYGRNMQDYEYQDE